VKLVWINEFQKNGYTLRSCLKDDADGN
jgi:hypothetical protein